MSKKKAGSKVFGKYIEKLTPVDEAPIKNAANIFARLRTRVLPIASVILPVGFLLSIAVNSLVFERWGLSFLQLASPSDVVMSGVQFSSILLTTFIAMAGAYFVSSILDAHFWRSVRRRIIHRVCHIVFMLVSFLISLYIAASREFAPPHGSILFMMGICFSIVLFGHQAIMRLAVLAPNQDLYEFRVKTFNGALLGLGMVISCGYLVIATLGLASSGYEPKPGLFTSIDNCQSKVLWVGEHDIVARCREGRRNSVLVVHQPQSLISMTPGPAN